MKAKFLMTGLLLAVGAASAAPVGILGVGSAGTVQASLTSLYWTPDPSANNTGAPPGFVANGEVNAGTTVTCVGCPLAVTEGIMINNNTPLVAGGALSTTFFRFANHPNLTYALTSVGPGSGNTNCAGLGVGQSCSIDVLGTTSPVVLTAQANGATQVSVALAGTATDGNGTSTWSGSFSTTIPRGGITAGVDVTPLAILQFFCGADATCTPAEVASSPSLTITSVSGSFNAEAAAVPEPGTISFVLLGSGLVGLSYFRRSRKAAK